MTEEITTKHLLNFLQEFKQSMEIKSTSMEGKIGATNDKIDKMDGKFKKMEGNIKELSNRIDAGDEKSERVNSRMNDRLYNLEKEMKRSVELKKHRENLKSKEKSATKNQETPEEQVDKTTRAVNHVINDKEITENVSTGTASSFRSDWARAMEMELEQAAAVKIQPPGRNFRREYPEVKDLTRNEREVPNNWEQAEDEDTDYLEQKREKVVPKIRKPVVVTNWFGADTTTDESTGEEDDNRWTEVERKKKADKKRKQMATKKEQKMKECALKARNMVGLGPIGIEDIEYRRSAQVGFEAAKKLAVKDFLADNLGYIKEELDSMEIAETRSTRTEGEILNVAFASNDDVREIHIRKAESQNDEITVRNYIPPNFFERYKAINKICNERRQENKNLKTQIRFGKRDIEVFTKIRGETTGFKLVALKDFTDVEQLPAYDHSIKWKIHPDRPPRRKVRYQNQKQDTGSSTAQATGQEETPKQLARVNSNSVTNESKKARMSAPSSGSQTSDSSSDGEMDLSGSEGVKPDSPASRNLVSKDQSITQ